MTKSSNAAFHSITTEERQELRHALQSNIHMTQSMMKLGQTCWLASRTYVRAYVLSLGPLHTKCGQKYIRVRAQNLIFLTRQRTLKSNQTKKIGVIQPDRK